MNFKRRTKEPLSLNVTPLIDVVFLLLIFFMTTTTFDQQTHLEIHLPDVENRHVLSSDQVIDIVINAKGQMEVNHQVLSDTKSATLKAALSQHPDFNPKGKLIISADAQAPHQAIMRAMDVAGTLGYSQIELRGQLN